MGDKSAFRIEAIPLLFALAANAAAQSFLLVVLPGIGRDLGFSAIQTGMLLGLGALALLASAPVWGSVSETRGRRVVLLAGFAGALIGPAVMAAIIALRLDGRLEALPALGLLIAARLVQSLLSGGLLPAAQAWMADRTGAGQRAEGMGLLGASYGMGGIAGAGSAFLAGGTAPVETLATLSAIVAVGFLLVRYKIVDRSASQPGDVGRADTRSLLRMVWPCLLITFLGVTVFGIMQHVTALRLEDSFGLPRAEAISQAGGALMGAAILMAFVQALGLRLLRLAPPRLMLAGGIGAAAAMVALAQASSIATLVASLLVTGAALGLLLPGNLAQLSMTASATSQGRAAGINAVAQGLGLAAGPLAGAALHGLSPSAPAIASLCAMVVVVAAAGWMSGTGARR